MKSLHTTIEDAQKKLKTDAAIAQNNPTWAAEEIVKLRKQLCDTQNCLMVYDVTLFCLVASGTVDELLMGQVRAAAEAHQHVMGEPSMLVENRCKKNFLEQSDASGR